MIVFDLYFPFAISLREVCNILIEVQANTFAILQAIKQTAG